MIDPAQPWQNTLWYTSVSYCCEYWSGLMFAAAAADP